jgi:hypothetical protein
MNTKMLLILGLGGVVLYFLVLKPAQQPKPTGAGAVLTDLGKLVGDFSGNAV